MEKDPTTAVDFSSARKIRKAELGEKLASKETTGLALSGGGIRSASFALGVVQAILNFAKEKGDKKLSDCFQYLSTVSGGGYLGAALTWLQSRGLDLGTHLDSDGLGVRNRGEKKVWLDYVRQHGNYLHPSSVSFLSIVSVVVRNLLISFTLYFGMVTLLLALALKQGFIGDFQVHSIPSLSFPGLMIIALTIYTTLIMLFSLTTFIGSFPAFNLKNWKSTLTQPMLAVAWLVLLSFIGYWVIKSGIAIPSANVNADYISIDLLVRIVFVFAVSSFFLLAFVIFVNSNVDRNIPSANYKLRLLLQQNAGKIIGFVLAMALLSTIAVVYYWLQEFESSEHTFKNALTLGGASSTIGLLGALYQYLLGRGKSVVSTVSSSIRIILTAGALVFGILLAAFTLAVEYEGHLISNWIAFFVLIMGVGLLVNANYFGLARMYRDRLMETFTPDVKAIESGQWKPALSADTLSISELDSINPYHIINANVVLVDSKRDYFKGRGGDSFIISPRFCGSEATGYVHTTEWLNDRMNLPTAVAISGAAVNPNTGVGGQGITRNRLVSFVLSFLQLRIGYWAPNVRFCESLKNKWVSNGKSHNRPTKMFASVVHSTIFKYKRWLSSGLRPNYWTPGLLQGLFGRGLNSNATWIELTDGGHFDNTGVYELIRREVDVIVLSIASADPNYQHEDLANLIRKARVDFGTIIMIDSDKLKATIPDQHSGFASKGFVTGRIKYRNGEKFGKIVLLMTTPIEDLPPEVLSYMKDNPNFPHESTSDQFYSEEQLEAYRELGFHIASSFLTDQEFIGFSNPFGEKT